MDGPAQGRVGEAAQDEFVGDGPCGQRGNQCHSQPGGRVAELRRPLRDPDDLPGREARPRAGVGEHIAGLGASSDADGGPHSVLGLATVTPTLLSAGTVRSTVPALARVSVDVRVPTTAAQDRVDELMRGLTAWTPGARLELGGSNGHP